MRDTLGANLALYIHGCNVRTMSSKDETKSEKLAPIRVTPTEKKAIYKLAATSGLSVSDYVRGTAIPDSNKKT